MKNGLWIAGLAVMALILGGGCEDTAAIERAERQAKQKEEAYKAAYTECQGTFDMAMAKERNNLLEDAATLYGQASSTAAQHADEPGIYKVKFLGIKSQAALAAERVKRTIEQNAQAAAAKAELAKKEKAAAEAAAKLKAEQDTKNSVAAPSAGVATATTSVADPTVKPLAPGATPAGGGDDDDDPLVANKPAAGGAAVVGGAAGVDGPKVPTDPFTPVDDKSPFKCYLVKSAKRYAVAYVVVRNTGDKERQIARFIADFATGTGDRKWPVVAAFKYQGFVATDWSDLDKENPNPLRNQQIGLMPGDGVKLVLITDKAERDGEYAKAVKLTGSVLWSDGSESPVVNNE